mmetsp:Transcript_25149/g.33347  ORF Transcript_25149/g.33347 Transcript_25149/m.33347 type:complete len:164 (-) Transcript_25149:284-775(-)
MASKLALRSAERADEDAEALASSSQQTPSTSPSRSGGNSMRMDHSTSGSKNFLTQRPGRSPSGYNCPNPRIVSSILQRLRPRPVDPSLSLVEGLSPVCLAVCPTCHPKKRDVSQQAVQRTTLSTDLLDSYVREIKSLANLLVCSSCPVPQRATCLAHSMRKIS